MSSNAPNPLNCMDKSQRLEHQRAKSEQDFMQLKTKLAILSSTTAPAPANSRFQKATIVEPVVNTTISGVVTDLYRPGQINPTLPPPTETIALDDDKTLLPEENNKKKEKTRLLASSTFDDGATEFNDDGIFSKKKKQKNNASTSHFGDLGETDDLLLKKKAKKPKLLSFEDDSITGTVQNGEKSDKKKQETDLVQLLEIGVESIQNTSEPFRIQKDDTVDVSFLPDKHREQQERILLEKAEKEWEVLQASIKEETLTITFSYYNGAGHRMETTVKKGDTILQFLISARDVIIKNGFPEMKRILPENLMYVKEDLILPQHYTFYDFFVTNARGKSGSLVNFGVQEDVRLKGDARVEKSNAHAGKIMEKSYYQKNKHLFPLNRFEQFDPKKKYDKYTIA